MSDTLFLTPRLRCRRWVAADLPQVFAVYADPQAMRFVGEGQPITQAQAGEWMAVTAHNYATRGYGMFALEDRASGAVVGFCGIVHPGGQPEPEVKYAFARQAWGRGLATEAVAALLAHAHAAFGLDRIIATVAEGNAGSQRVMDKVGARLAQRRTQPDGHTTLVYEWRPGDRPGTAPPPEIP